MPTIHPMRQKMSKRDSANEDDFDKLNIYYRICIHFCQGRDCEEGICECNRRLDQHRDPRSQSTPSWTMEHNTRKERRPAYGYLESGTRYAQLALDTPVEKVEQLLVEVWKIPKPRLVMSIIGGTQYFVLNDRLETDLIKGILHVAVKSDVWLFTNGYNVNIVQLVGQAISKNKFTNPKKQITAIGICKWGCVRNVIALQKEHDKLQQERKGIASNDQDQEQYELEMNHSHCLMLDDGTLHRRDTHAYRTHLTAHIGKSQDEHGIPIPTVTVMVEGGRETITNVYEDLKAGIPVVIVKGSNGAADLIIRWLIYTKHFDESVNDPLFETAHDVCELKEKPRTSSKTDEKADVKFQTNVQGELFLDKSLTELQCMFGKYELDLKRDIKMIISYDRHRAAANVAGESNEDEEEKAPQNTRVGEKTVSTKSLPAKKKTIDEDVLKWQVLYCLQPAVRSRITVFNANSESNLSEAIFRGICHARQKDIEQRALRQKHRSEVRLRREGPPPTTAMTQTVIDGCKSIHQGEESILCSQLLQLTMDWNCIDVAKELVLKNSLDGLMSKSQPFINALIKGLPAFVYEFIKLGLDPSEIFFPDNDFVSSGERYRLVLNILYTVEAVNSDNTHLRFFIQEDSDVYKRHIDNIDTLNDILTDLVGNYMHKLYFNSHRDEKHYQAEHSLVEKPSAIILNADDQTAELKGVEAKQRARDCIMRDLFLWAVLMNRIDMAKMFLSHMKYRICSALIAVKILKQYHKKATHEDIRSDYQKSIDYFEMYAINCLDKCDDHDREKACEIVLQQNDLYGYVTCLQVAANAKAKLFVATPCCVQAMNDIWYDKIRPRKSLYVNLPMLLGLLSIGLLAPIMVNFRKSEEESRDRPQEHRLSSNGITYSDPYESKHARHCDNILNSRYARRLTYFHRALCVKFWYHLISYIGFLLLFSYMLLFRFHPRVDQRFDIHWTEILTYILVVSMVLEEIHCFCHMDTVMSYGKISAYLYDFFKGMTAIGFLLFLLGVILRFSCADTEKNFTAARIVMALDLELWWLRSLSFVMISSFLGPHLVAISKMLKDLVFFMCIMAIVMIAYGITSRSMVYYPSADKFNTTTDFDGRSLFRQIAYPVYYLMYGEFGKELDNLDDYPDAGWSIATQILLATHMLFMNILLINLLIAIFSKRFDQIYDDTKNIWHSQQYSFTRQYYTVAPFFQPVTFLYDFYRFVRMVYFRLRALYSDGPKERHVKVFKMIPSNKLLIKEWYEFEGASTYEYADEEVETLFGLSSTRSSSDGLSREESLDHKRKIDQPSDHLKKIENDLIGLQSTIKNMEKEMQKSMEVIRMELKQLVAPKSPSNENNGSSVKQN